MIVKHENWEFETNVPYLLVTELLKANDSKQLGKACEIQFKIIEWAKRSGPDLSEIGIEDVSKIINLILTSNERFLANK